MPVFPTPPVAGRVIDAKSGAPVAGAIVVVRYDARYDDLLPDRDVLGYRELRSPPPTEVSSWAAAPWRASRSGRWRKPKRA